MLADIEARAARHALTIMGGTQAIPSDGLPEGTQALLLLGPKEPGFWAHFTTQPEWQDGAPDPMDRWSARVIGALAAETGTQALFPFGGPPWWPFYRWAERTGRAFASPVRLLVHDESGLFFSCRGALALPMVIDLPPPTPSPCANCGTQPCRTACPAGALTANGYDVPACHAFLDTSAGTDCLSRGCAVRRACPRSQGHARIETHSAYHMRQFHR
ncbi:hypothetical protein SAMN05878503_10441 [Cereibacter ovatus]|uniref:4Fe-4S ferredoxin-type domain-containing protein n=1 Tax=Cereibacter ovatus TaxID=439529 RepID=A0A285CPI5_9RHOB|nr:ferredoxin [Cereibacter ovatus]SNX69441.1 hypothetical protein SAMN05878503_10441 [Cereibacter ovatus]